MDYEMLFYVAGAVALCIITWTWISCLRKCGPNEAMIIYGEGCSDGKRKFKIVRGGGAMVAPMLQQCKYLSLEVMTFDLAPQTPIIFKNGVPIFVSTVAQVKVKPDEDSIARAAERLLGKSNEEIANLARDVLEGKLRALLGTMDVLELIQNWEAASDKVIELSEPALNRLGLTMQSFIFKEIKDNVGVLEALGKAVTATFQKDSEIQQAAARKEAAIAKLQSELDLGLLTALSVDAPQMSESLHAYQKALPILEEALSNNKPVLADFLRRYALLLASTKDPPSIELAEQLKERADHMLSAPGLSAGTTRE